MLIFLWIVGAFIIVGLCFGLINFGIDVLKKISVWLWAYLIMTTILFAATADLIFSAAIPLVFILPLRLLFYLINTFVFKKTKTRNEEEIIQALKERDQSIKEGQSFTITIEPKS